MRTIRSRLVVGLVVMMLPLVILALGSFSVFDRILNSVDEILEESTYEMMPVVRLQELVNQSAMPANDYLLHGSTLERDNFEAISLQTEVAFGESLMNIQRYGTASEFELLMAAKERWESGVHLSRRLLSLPMPLKEPVLAATEMEIMDQHYNQASALVSEVMQIIHQESHDSAMAAHNELDRLIRLIGWLSLIGIICALSIGILIARSILKPLRKLYSGAQAFGAGHLDHRVELTGDDELQQLAGAFNRMADKVQHLTLRDTLTGLLNRRSFDSRLYEEAQRCRRNNHPISLLMIDFDHFKRVNDTHGHLAGDQVLRELSGRIVSLLRDIDPVFRYGGEELIALLPETDKAHAVVAAERIRRGIEEQPVEIRHGDTIPITVSIGVAVCPYGHTDQETIIRAADKALYRAKALGRNRVEVAEMPKPGAGQPTGDEDE